MTQAQSARVLVVGAGPSGLMMAHELKRFGVDVVIVEQAMEKSFFTRAIGVQVRTLEIFSSLKILNALEKKAHEVNFFEIIADNFHTRLKISDLGFSVKGPLIIDQSHTEETLENALNSQGKKVERGVEFVKFAKLGEKFLATLIKDGKDFNETFDFIIGADGAKSLVRKNAQIKFSGTIYPEAFILADAQVQHMPDHNSFRICLSKEGLFGLIPMQGEKHFRLISLRRNEFEKKGPPPTLKEFQSLAKKLVPYDISIDKPSWISRFFVQCRSAEKYSKDHVFLIGDAAHIHSPAGGQGMNTGLQDAFNLSFKLAFFLKGLAHEKILSTYDKERRPVGEFLIKYTDRMFRLMARGSFLIRLVRRIVLPLLNKKKSWQKKLFFTISQTRIGYKKGLLDQKFSQKKLGPYVLGMRVKNISLKNFQGENIFFHELFSSLKIFSIIIFPKNISQKIFNEQCAAQKKLQKKFPEIIFSYQIFCDQKFFENNLGANNFFCEKFFEKDFVDQPMHLLVRPDHHLMAIYNCNQWDKAKSFLQIYFREN